MPHASQYFVDKTEALIIDNALKRAIEESNQHLVECRNRSPNRYQPLLIKDSFLQKTDTPQQPPQLASNQMMSESFLPSRSALETKQVTMMQSEDNQTFENITITESRNQKKKSLFKHAQARNPLVAQAEKVTRRH